jgi:hypothetical protein
VAISNLNLNVTANTARALADFNKFSRSLDNKFLISGLKLDVVRGALSQINRDFQRAIGEQGLASASSLRAAQNQAALLTQTFKGFASESALAITTNIGTALNQVAVTAGGTMKDVQKTLLATPFISTRLSEDVRLGLSKGVLDFQKNIRRAGLGDNFGGVAQQFLMGTKTTMQMVQSGNPLEMFLGSELIKRGAGVGEIASPEVRSKLMKDLVEDSALGNQLKIAAKRAAGFRIILEDMNSTLFNPESGVFGSLKKVVDAAGNPTTMFDEVEKLVEQVFGDNGLFATLVKSFRSVFGSGDPMRPFIDGVQFMTRIFKSITEYFNTPGFKAVLGYVKDIVERVTTVFTGIYQQIRGSSFSSSEITRTIGEIGESIRGYIRQFGETIRNKNVSGESGFAGDILGTLVEEVGRTAVVLIKELLMTLVNKVPEIATAVLPAINKGINGILTEAFGQTGAALVKFIAGFVPGPIGMIARASAVGDVTGGGGSVGSMLAMGAGALLGPGALFGAARAGRGLFGGDQARMGLLTDLTRRTSGVEEVYNRRMRQLYLPGAQRNPLSRLLGSALSPRSRFNLPPSPGGGGGGGFGGYRFPTDPMMGPSSPYGRITARTSALAGTVGYDIPSSQLFQNRSGRITPGTSMFNIPGFNPGGAINRQTTMFQPPTGRELFPFIATGRPRTGMRNFPVEGAMQIRRPGLFPSAYERMRMGYINDNNEVDYPGVYDNRLSRTPSQGTIDRYNRMYGVRGRMSTAGRGVHRIGMGGGYMMAGSLAAEFAGQAVGGAGGKILSGLGQGAMLGGQIGMVLGPKGALAGAAIGAVLGGIAPLMDKGVRDGVGTFISGMGNTMKALGSGIVTGITELGNGLLSALSSLPKMASGVMQGIYNTLPAPIKATMGFLNTAWSGVTGFVSRLNIPMPFYAGKDYAGPAMALEARMSGRRPMVVNDGEFVIPRDGFPTLAGLVGDNLRSTGVVNQGTSQPVQVNVTLAITTNAVVADPNELANALREPVYKIIGEAWNEAYNSTRIHRAKVS